MPTPGSGAISMNDMNVEILRASGTATISMSTVRTRYGGSGSISFSDLRNSEGFTVTCSTYSSKFISFDGWSQVFAVGSVSPNESSGFLQFAANSFLGALSSSAGTPTDAGITIFSNTGSGTSGVTNGFRGDQVTRVVTANTSRTIQSGTENATGFDYDVPSSGTIHCLVKF
jgi:hypothetical protein